MDIDKEKITQIINELDHKNRKKFISDLTELFEKETYLILSHVRSIENLKSTPIEIVHSFKKTISNNIRTIGELKKIVEKLSDAEKTSNNESEKTIKALEPLGRKKQGKSKKSV